jgi:hypothetical protein
MTLAVLLFGGFSPAAWSMPKASAKPASRAFKPPGEVPVKVAEKIDVCFNYGCASEGEVIFSGRQLTQVRSMLRVAQNSEHERSALADVIAQMYAWAAEQTPVGNDRAGNFADGGMPGQMDCIDHSTTTTRFLRLLEGHGWLRFHRPVDTIRRSGIFLHHFSAAIEDLGDGISIVRTDIRSRLWAVDSWYADNGKPPYIAPIDEWERDSGPN